MTYPLDLSFSGVAVRYEREAVVQQKAADRLFQLLRIREGDAVIDVGCGSGSLTRRIRGMSKGAVVGIDPAEGMIVEARRLESLNDTEGRPPIEYRILRAQELGSQTDLHGRFDVVFCNSTFHWIRPVAPAIEGFRRCLKKGGKLGIQAAAMTDYCPVFIKAIDYAKHHDKTAGRFRDFVPPWTFLETEEAYANLFKSAGFDVPYTCIEQATSRHTVEEAYGVFAAGAATGYLDQDNYRNGYDPQLQEVFMSLIRESLASQAGTDGLLNLIFHRAYVIAFKQ